MANKIILFKSRLRKARKLIRSNIIDKRCAIRLDAVMKESGLDDIDVLNIIINFADMSEDLDGV